jgi:hypothetical protein
LILFAKYAGPAYFRLYQPFRAGHDNLKEIAWGVTNQLAVQAYGHRGQGKPTSNKRNPQ